MVDQRRFDDQRGDRWVDSATAARRLGISVRTLYAYVSRGTVRSVPGGRGRPRRYALADLERLRVRRDARRGHGPVAAGALRWGEPVLDSAITAITPRGPMYRGIAAADLVADGAPFEHAAELLWSGARPSGATIAWPRVALPIARIAALVAGAHPLDVMAVVVALVRIGSGTRLDDARSGRALIPLLAACLAPDAAGMTRALGAHSVAGIVARALGCDGRERAIAAIDAALVLLADHELNASSFAARVAASTGADSHACVAAALATLTGPLHGRAAEAWAMANRRDDASVLGHPLYPHGDPRAPPLLDFATAMRSRRGGALAARIHRSRIPPSVDAALAVLVAALGAPPAAASGLFAVARCAGWLAHAAEQRAAGYVLRPRARYVGPT
jgi:citrate synthase